ncbi:MAG: hypothetical protein ACC645_08075 [Pirellulales bacterium]
MVRRTLAIGSWAWVVLAVVSSANAQLKMIGIAGAEVEGAPDPDFFEENITLWDVNMADGSSQLIRELPFVPRDRDIEWNPLEGRLYRVSGSSSNRGNDPAGSGYRDNQYMDSVDVYDFQAKELKSSGNVQVLFNANPNPPDSTPNDIIPVFGDPGPAPPTWLLPNPRRTVDQTDPSFGNMFGDGEYKKARGLVWSIKDNWGYVISDNGLFKYTPDTASAGSSTLIAEMNDDPNTARNEATRGKAGVLYHPQPGTTQFWVSMKTGDNEGAAAPDLYQMNPATAEFDFNTGLSVRLMDENGTETRDIEGLVSLEQDPNTGILYGVTKGIEDVFERQLIQFETDENGELTGRASIVGDVQLGDITETARYTIAIVGYRTGDMDQNGNVDFDDIAAFVLGLNDPTAYEEAFGLKSRVSGDTDGNGRLDFDDIGRFVAMFGSGGLSAQQTVPEPSGIVLAGLAFAGLFGCGWRVRQRRE